MKSLILRFKVQILTIVFLTIPVWAFSQVSPGATVTADLTLTGDLDASSYGGTALIVGADNITIDGAGYTITVNGNNFAFEINGHTGVTVQNVTVTGTSTGQGRGFSINNGNSLIIQNNTLSGLYDAVYVLGTGSNSVVSSNDMSGCNTPFGSQTYANEINWTITNNNMTNSSGWAIAYKGTPAEISGNDFTGSANGLLLSNANFPTSSPFVMTWQGAASGPNQNTFGSIANQVFQFENCSGLDVSGWDISSLYTSPAGHYGFYLNAVSNSTFANNNLSGLGIAIQTDQSGSNNVIDGNNMSGCNSGMGFNAYHNNNANWTVTNNNVTNCTGWGIAYAGSPAELSGNDFTGSANGLYLRGANYSSSSPFVMTWQGSASGSNQNTFGSIGNQLFQFESCSGLDVSGWDISSLYTSPAGHYGFYLSAVSNSTFSNNNLSGLGIAIQTDQSGSNNVIDGNNMSGCNSGMGFNAYHNNNANWTVTNNDVTNCSSWGIAYWGSPAELSGNDFTGSANGLYLRGASYSASSPFVMTWQGAASGPNKNTFGSIGNQVLQFESCSGLNVSGWDIPSLYTNPAGKYGLYLTGVSNSTFANNNLSGLGIAIQTDQSGSNNVIDGNNMSGCTSGMGFNAYHNNNANWTVTNNDVTNCTSWGIAYWGSPAELSGNDFTGSVNGLLLRGASYSASSPFVMTWQGTASGPNQNTFGSIGNQLFQFESCNGLNISGWDFPSLYTNPAGKYGLYLNSVNNSIFANNNLSGLGSGIYSTGTCSYNEVSNNDFSGCSSGLSYNVYGTNDNQWTITGNDLTACTNWAISYSGVPADISSNDFTGSVNGMYLRGANGYTLNGKSNTWDVSDAGTAVQIDYTGNMTLDSLTVHGAGGTAVSVDHSNSITVNALQTCGKDVGVNISTGSNHTISNSSFGSGGIGINVGNGVSNTQVTNNSFYDMTNQVGDNGTGTIVTGSQTVTSDPWCSGGGAVVEAEPYFVDPLTGPDSPQLPSIDPDYTYTSAGLLRQTSTMGYDGWNPRPGDRPMIKTAFADYLDTDFRAEITVTQTDPSQSLDLIYFGFGSGEPNTGYVNEPTDGFYFRIHHGGGNPVQAAFYEGQSNPSWNSSNNVGIGTFNTNGTTFRIDKIGNDITLSIVGGGSATFHVSDVSAITASNGYVFFGNGAIGTTFSNLIVEPPPSNTPPVAAAGDDQTFDCVVGSAAVTLDGSASSDADSDSLSYRWILNGTEVSTQVSFTDSLGNGIYAYILTVSDGTASASDTVGITVNTDQNAPVITLAGANPDTIVCLYSYTDPGASVTDSCDTNPVLTVTDSVNTGQVGSYSVTYTAVDESGNSTTVVRTVAVINHPPVVDNPVGEVALYYGTSTLSTSIDLSTVFSDPDGHHLRFSATIDDSSIAGIALAGDQLTVTLGSLGTAIVTVTADDSCGGTVQDVFTVSIEVVPDLGDAVLFAVDQADLDRSIHIHSGNVIVNESATDNSDHGHHDSHGDHDDHGDHHESHHGNYGNHGSSSGHDDHGEHGDHSDHINYELTIGRNVTTPAGYSLRANAIQIDREGSIGGDAYYNILSSASTIAGDVYSPLSLPQFVNLPPLAESAPGTQDISVRRNHPRTLDAGDYDEIEVKERGVLILTGGVYNVQELKLHERASLQCAAGVEIRIAQQLKVDANAFVGSTGNANVSAADILLIVSGDMGHHNDVTLGENSTISANLFAMGHLLTFKHGVNATGAFWAREIKVGNNVSLTLDGHFTLGSDDLAAQSKGENQNAINLSVLPSEFALRQNYPNPFKPTTTITYALPDGGVVSLKVYDIRGAMVESLVQGYQPAGYYQVQFGDQQLSSGTYFYVLKAGSFREVKQMVFLK